MYGRRLSAQPRLSSVEEHKPLMNPSVLERPSPGGHYASAPINLAMQQPLHRRTLSHVPTMPSGTYPPVSEGIIPSRQDRSAVPGYLRGRGRAQSINVAGDYKVRLG